MEIKKSELVFDGKLLKLYKDEVKLDNGLEVTREVVRHHGAAAVIPVTDSGEVILVRQFRYAVGTDTLEIPAGCLEQGETFEQCAARETEEEIGYRPKVLRPLFQFFPSPGYSGEKIGIFLGYDLVATRQHLDPDESVQVVILPLDEAVDKIRSGEIVDGKTIAAIMFISSLSLQYGQDLSAGL